MIGYNVAVRSLLVAAALFLSPAAFADVPATSSTSGAMVSSTAAAPAPSGGMRPGIAAPAKSKHPYFFAAYAAVWGGLFVYALWLGSRISSLEQKVTSVTDRSR